MYTLPQWAAFLADVKAFLQQQSLAPQRVFISYAWEGDSIGTQWLQTRLTRWQSDLSALGLTVFFDLTAMGGKSTIEATMRENLAKSHAVLAIATPMYGTRVQDSKTNVAYEYRQTLEKLALHSQSVIPLWLAGSPGSPYTICIKRRSSNKLKTKGSQL